jgi:hypothetical protein
MEEKETNVINDDSVVSSDLPVPAETSPQELTVIQKTTLDQESIELLNQIIAETDVTKAKDLTHLFNLNQNKKTMIRINKLNELLDVIAGQTMVRFASRPDEISNQELLQGLKVVQDIIERGQKQIVGNGETPLIQINQQNNEVNLGGAEGTLSKESRDKVKNAVMAILAGINTSPAPTTDPIIVEAEVVSTEDEETTNNDEC